MPRFPQIAKFKGDNESSFLRWCLQFEAQLKAFSIEDDDNSWRDLLLIYTEDNAFTVASKAIVDDNGINFEGLKTLLQQRFCGPDYKRALELKLRNLKFKKGIKIAPFVNELRNAIQELYGLTSEDAIDSIAINHVLAQLEDSLRKETKILQLAGNTKLENILELLQEKFEGNSFALNESSLPFFQGATMSPRPVQNSPVDADRLSRLETMMASVMNKLDQFQSTQSNTAGRRVICEHCQRTGHDKARCFQLKTCHTCNKTGHIAKYCKEKPTNPPSNNFATTVLKCDDAGKASEITPGRRIMIKIRTGEQELDFLYDPGSQFSIIPLSYFDKLENKPPLVPIKESGVGVAGNKFPIDGVAYLNLQLIAKDRSTYLLEYEPVLITAAVDTCIFGVKTERRFTEIRRSQKDMTLTFIPPGSDGVTVQCYYEKESQNSHAYIKVAKTTVVQDTGLTWVKGKIQNYPAVRGKETAFYFEGSDELKTQDMHIYSYKCDQAQKTVRIPIRNDSYAAIKLRKGDHLGTLRGIELASASCQSSRYGLDLKEISFGDLQSAEKERLENMLVAYDEEMQKRPAAASANMPIQHEINLVDEFPVSLPPRRLAHSQRDVIAQQIETLKDKGFVEKSYSPYGAPIVPVMKKDGSLRLCIDYRQLNAKTIPAVYPIPRADDILDSLHGSKYFTVLDLKDAYHQIALKDEDKHKTAFVLPWEKLQWRRMPFGLIGAPYSLSAGMDYALTGCKTFAQGYYDDIIVYSKDLETHMVHVGRVLSCLAECGLQINYKKCEFVRQQVSFVGHILSGNGVRPAAQKVSDIINFPPPSDINSLRSFLGMASFYRKFVEKFSVIAMPLYSLLKKGATFSWSDQCKQAFDYIKEKLSNSNILVFPDFAKPFALQTDASNDGLGFVLSQEHNSIMKPVLFGGRLLSETERRYAVTDKELLAIFYAVKRCEVYLLGHSFVVYTDHKPLSYLKEFKDIANRRFCWISYLEELGTVIQYIQGKDNVIADFMSRNIAKVEKEIHDGTPVTVGTLKLDYLGYDITDLMNVQLEDLDIQQVVRVLDPLAVERTTGEVPKEYKHHMQKLFVDEDKLLKYRHHSNVCFVVPEHLRAEILALCHNQWTSGHFGVYKTHRRVLELFWWPGLYKHVNKYINNCHICLRVKRQGKKQGCMGVREWPEHPLDLVSIDYLVELPVTARSNKHIMIINDHFSKFIQAYAVKDRTALTASKCVLDYCLKFGIPLRLFSDRDPAFEATLFQELMKALGVKKLRTTGYNPRSNGLTEQSNSMVKDYLLAYLEESDSDRPEWDCWLRELAYAYNSSVHSSTGFSPVELMFGRKFRVPADILYGNLNQNREMPYSVEHFSQKLALMYDIARHNMVSRQKVYSTYYDEKVRDDKLKTGDLVYIYLPAKKREKLTIKWVGPYKIVGESHPVYHVEVLSEKKSYVKVQGIS